MHSRFKNDKAFAQQAGAHICAAHERPDNTAISATQSLPSDLLTRSTDPPFVVGRKDLRAKLRAEADRVVCSESKHRARAVRRNEYARYYIVIKTSVRISTYKRCACTGFPLANRPGL